jgi:queuosine precursor transporter
MFSPVRRYRWTLVYILLIPLVNWAFSWTPLFALPDGGKWSPFSLVVGLILVFRDFAQQEIGHFIFMPLAVGVAISFAMAPPQIALASGVAFLFGESVDWLIFTITKKPLSGRILYSCAASVPVDSVIYLTGANHVIPGLFTWWMLGTMIVSKMVGAVVVFYMIRNRERRSISQTAG